MSTKFLITGANGQLAKEFIRLFNEKGIDYVAFSRQELDVSDFFSVNKIIKETRPDIILNCSAYNNVDEAESKFYEALKVNSLAVYNLAIACREIRARFVHYSTDYVFDGTKGGLYLEEDLPNPLSKYATTKLVGENLLKDVLTDGYLIFRVSWVYGEGRQNFIYKLLMWSKQQENLRVAYNEVSVPTYAGFIALKSYEAIKKGLKGLYHLVPMGYASRYEWAKKVFENLGIKKDIQPVSKEIFDLPARRPDFSAMDSSKIRTDLEDEFPHWVDLLKGYLKSMGGL